MKVYVFDVESRTDSDRTGLPVGSYAVHVSEERGTATLMLRPAGERSFRLGVPGEEER